MKATLELDEHHWWYRGRRRVILAELERLALPGDARVLDAGCGSGRTLQELTRYGEVHGIELSPDAAAVARALCGVNAICHQAAMVGLGQNMLDIRDYAHHNDLGTAVLLRELAAARRDSLHFLCRECGTTQTYFRSVHAV